MLFITRVIATEKSGSFIYNLLCLYLISSYFQYSFPIRFISPAYHHSSLPSFLFLLYINTVWVNITQNRKTTMISAILHTKLFQCFPWGSCPLWSEANIYTHIGVFENKYLLSRTFEDSWHLSDRESNYVLCENKKPNTHHTGLHKQNQSRHKQIHAKLLLESF